MQPFSSAAGNASTPEVQPKAAILHSLSDSQLQMQRPPITITGTSTPTLPVILSPASVLSDVVSAAQNNDPQRMLSREALFAEAFNAASRALPQDDKPPSFKDKLKSRIRRALLRKFILRMLIGKNAADFIYPWIHPSARASGFAM